jgi:hypothetical protein
MYECIYVCIVFVCKWNQINYKLKKKCHEMEPNPSKNRTVHEGDNPSFLNESMNIFLTIQFVSSSSSNTCTWIQERTELVVRPVVNLVTMKYV